ncbi:MAG: hypothetical protein RMK84_05470 [Oscillochloridaceae bacterium]|nr:hypothetical protein [Chloroflexaceae bacterium]MDW8389553.1 hypothetical protein [Oscillochloridaceae bacterium]
MNIFDLRDRLIEDYNAYISSFFQIRDPAIRAKVDEAIHDGLLWPEALIQLNPAVPRGHSAWCARIRKRRPRLAHNEWLHRVSRPDPGGADFSGVGFSGAHSHRMRHPGH